MLQVKPFHIRRFLPLPYEEALAPRLHRAQEKLQAGDAAGWVRLSGEAEPWERVKTAAAKIQRDSQALVVIGNRGACLGARGVIDCLCSSARVPHKEKTIPVYFLEELSADAVWETLAQVAGREFSVAWIAASGETAQSGAVLRCFRAALEARYGRRGARERLYVIGPQAEPKDWEAVFLPEKAEDRYGLLTAAGLLPMAAAGVDVDSLLRGAEDMMNRCAQGGYDCPAWQYAALRYELYRTGRSVEVLACCDPAFGALLEWWRRLFSQGGRRGLFPAAGFTGDLSATDWEEGEDKLPIFETVLHPGPSRHLMRVPGTAREDGLEFLAGESLDYIRDRALEGTLLAHTEGGVPNIIVETGGKTERGLGELIYFFQYACGLSSCLLAGDPWERPEDACQSNVLALLGKPGWAGRRAALEEKLRSDAALWTV